MFWGCETVPLTLSPFQFYFGSSSHDIELSWRLLNVPWHGNFSLCFKTALERFVCHDGNNGETPICFRHSVRQLAIKRLPSQLLCKRAPAIPKSPGILRSNSVTAKHRVVCLNATLSPERPLESLVMLRSELKWNEYYFFYVKQWLLNG